MNFYMDDIPVKLIADYVLNSATENSATEGEDKGFQFGMRLGRARVPKSMEGFVYYRHLEAEAAVGALSDSDFGGGGTNHKGFITGLKYQFLENTQLGLTYYTTEQIENTGNVKDDSNTLQLDMSVKF